MNDNASPEGPGSVPMPASGWRLLGFGKHANLAANIQDQLRTLGLRSTNFALTDDAEGDARLVAELEADVYDGVVIGGHINGQNPGETNVTEEATMWLNRVLNLIHLHAPSAKIILTRGPADALSSIERVLGPIPGR